MKPLNPPFTHYTIDETGLITVAKTRTRSPQGSVVTQHRAGNKLRVKLTDDNGVTGWQLLHVLVWNTFAAEKLIKGDVIRFLDGDSLNVSFDNLVVVKRGDKRELVKPDLSLVPVPKPVTALVAGGKKTDWRGEENPNAVLNDHQIAIIRFFNKRMTQAEIAERLCVSQAAISHVVTGKTWKHV